MSTRSQLKYFTEIPTLNTLLMRPEERSYNSLTIRSCSLLYNQCFLQPAFRPQNKGTVCSKQTRGSMESCLPQNLPARNTSRCHNALPAAQRQLTLMRTLSPRGFKSLTSSVLSRPMTSSSLRMRCSSPWNSTSVPAYFE
jgi:hypothetical protein